MSKQILPEDKIRAVKEYLEGRTSQQEQAKKLGVKNVATHVGYMPENPYDPNYAGTIVALKTLCSKCKDNGLYFNFERIYRNKPEGYTYKRERTWQFNNLKPREYK